MDYQYHIDDLEIFRSKLLEYLSYMLTNTPPDATIRHKLYTLVDLCLDARKDGLRFDRAQYLVKEIGNVTSHFNYNKYEIIPIEEFFKAMDRNDKLEKLGIK